MHQEAIEMWIERVTKATQLLLEQAGPHRWLLRQSLYTHYQRLVTLTMTSLQSTTGSILDVGAGTGALALDLAWFVGDKGRVIAVDRDPAALNILQQVAGKVAVSVATVTGEATALPIGDAQQNLTVARYTFQHLPAPMAALAEMKRVTRPGGRILIIDVDDDVTLSHPPVPTSLERLQRCLRALQSKRGGDRLIGRRLYQLLRRLGLKAIQVILIPRVQLGLQHGRDAGIEAHQVERLLEERESLVDAGLITASEFDTAIAELRQGFSEDRFEMNADFIATGLVPPR